MFTLVLLQSSVTVYVLVTTTGHVPVLASLLATVKSPSAVHASAIDNPNPSKPATVVSAAGASLAPQPSIVVSAIVPVTTGAVLSVAVII